MTDSMSRAAFARFAARRIFESPHDLAEYEIGVLPVVAPDVAAHLDAMLADARKGYERSDAATFVGGDDAE